MKKIIYVMLSVVILTMLISCGKSTHPIVGRWEREGTGIFSELEFFSDGTYASSVDYASGTYSVTDNRLRLSTQYSSDWTYSFEIKNNTLTLIDEDETMKLKRVKD